MQVCTYMRVHMHKCICMYFHTCVQPVCLTMQNHVLPLGQTLLYAMLLLFLVALLFLIVFLAGCACRRRRRRRRHCRCSRSRCGHRLSLLILGKIIKTKAKEFSSAIAANILAPIPFSLSQSHLLLLLSYRDSACDSDSDVDVVSCRVVQFCSFCPLNTLSSSVALFFWSWFVLSFNVLRTQAHTHNTHMLTLDVGCHLPFWTNYFSRRRRRRRRCINNAAVH